MLSQIGELTMQGIRETVPIYCPLPYKEVIEKCWAQNPSDRPKWDWVISQLNATWNLEPDASLIEYLDLEEKTIKGRATSLDTSQVQTSSVVHTTSVPTTVSPQSSPTTSPLRQRPQKNISLQKGRYQSQS